MPHDPVNHPKHYTSHPSGVECITITEHMGFNLGNALKYIWRADLKHDAVEDLKKARWYLDRELAKRAAPDTSETAADSWIEWRGGIRPIADYVKVECKLRCGVPVTAKAGAMAWNHHDDGGDIVAYRIVQAD